MLLLLSDLGFVGSAQQVGESGGEDSEDEWNYIKVEKKSELAAVKEEVSEILESPLVEEREEISQFEEDKENVSWKIFPNRSKQFQFEFFQHPEIIESENQPENFDLESIESPLSEVVKDIEQEKEELDERHAQDEVEKDFQLTIETGEEFDEMSVQLNPDAKEFIPISPTRNNGMMSPPLNPKLNSIVIEDAVVSQSPRKGEHQLMEDVLIPSEMDFDSEANERPHEVENNVESPELLNLKESMQQDDKLQQEYKDEAQNFEEVKKQTGEEYPVLEKSFNEYSNGFQSHIDDAMNRSFYEGRDNGDILTADVLNSVQPIPTFEDEQNFVEKPEINLTGSHEWGMSADASAAVAMDSSDNFEAERFVEEIKGAAFDKYVDQGLSPTLPEFSMNTIQTVEETIMADNQSMEPIQESIIDPIVSETSEIVQEIFIPEVVPEIQEPMPEIQEPTPEIQESMPEIQEPTPEIPAEEPKVEAEVIAAAAAVIAVAGATVAAKKKAPTKLEPKKTEVKAKAPVASKTTTVTKKPAAPVAPAVKAASAPIRRPATTTTAAKPTASSVTAARPKPAVAPIKKAAPTTTAAPAPKPAPISRPTTLAPKKPVTSVAAAK